MICLCSGPWPNTITPGLHSWIWEPATSHHLGQLFTVCGEQSVNRAYLRGGPLPMADEGEALSRGLSTQWLATDPPEVSSIAASVPRTWCHLTHLGLTITEDSHALGDWLARVSICDYDRLNACLINCQSICNKAITIKDYIMDNSMDVILLGETWLSSVKEKKNCGNIVPTGFDYIVCVNRGRRIGGGVAIIHRKTIALC